MRIGQLRDMLTGATHCELLTKQIFQQRCAASACRAQVAPVAGVAFNNLACAQLPLPQPAGAPAPAPSGSPQQLAELPPGNSSANPNPLYVEYAPVVYLDSAQSVAAGGWTSDPNSFTTFLVRRGPRWGRPCWVAADTPLLLCWHAALQ